MVGEHFDTGGERPAVGRDRADSTSRYLGVHFACCSVYTRVYANPQGTQYVGHCPRCGRRIAFRIGPDGTDHRFFTVY
jgi:hypothetical protein